MKVANHFISINWLINLNYSFTNHTNPFPQFNSVTLKVITFFKFSPFMLQKSSLEQHEVNDKILNPLN